MYGPITAMSEIHRQNLLQDAEQQRLVKQTRANKPAGSFYSLIQKALAHRRSTLAPQFSEPMAPAYADRAQIKFDTGVFPAV